MYYECPLPTRHNYYGTPESDKVQSTGTLYAFTVLSRHEKYSMGLLKSYPADGGDSFKSMETHCTCSVYKFTTITVINIRERERERDSERQTDRQTVRDRDRERELETLLSNLQGL